MLSTLRSHFEKISPFSYTIIAPQHTIISKYQIIHPYIPSVVKEINIYTFIAASIACQSV